MTTISLCHSFRAVRPEVAEKVDTFPRVRILTLMTEEEFAEKVRGPARGCWLWNGTVSQKGYGVASVEGHRPIGAHRIVVEILTGRPLLQAEFACHTCDVRACVRPDHLYLGSAGTNATSRPRRISDAPAHWSRARKEAWVRGEEFQAAPTNYLGPTRKKRCLFLDSGPRTPQDPRERTDTRNEKGGPK